MTTPSASEKSSQIPSVTVTSYRKRSGSEDSTALKSPRTPRFAEATAVHSPIDLTLSSNPFGDPPTYPGKSLTPPTNHFMPQAQVSDVGFGYLNGTHESVEMEDTDNPYLVPPPKSPLKSPLKSAMKSPGAPPRNINTGAILSPTFQQEQALDDAEKQTDKQQARDLKTKTRVRMAKFLMRGVNFSCSLIVLSMLSTSLTIFHATKSLAPRNGLPAWAPNTKTWPQILLLSIACVSLFAAVLVFWGYWKGGHRRAEKVAVYYTTFSVAFFILSIVMWVVGAVIFNNAKAKGNGQDLWGWSCKENNRRNLFKDDVSYALVCRLQNWALLCCIIEVVVEVITIMIYGVVFYRYYSKRKLRKSMANRDRARSDLYLAQLKAQSAPNTPGLPGGLLSPRDGGWRPPQGFEAYNEDRKLANEDDDSIEGVQYAVVNDKKVVEPKPFALKAPPIKVHAPTPKIGQDAFQTPTSPQLSSSPPPFTPTPAPETIQDHVPAAPGEAQYGAVAVPGAYSSPLNSPGFAPQHSGIGISSGLDGRLAGGR